MKLAELEAKAKALAGTQRWRGVDPEAVLEALGEVARLRAEVVERTHIANEQWLFAKKNGEKLAKARAALQEANATGAEYYMLFETARTRLRQAIAYIVEGLHQDCVEAVSPCCNKCKGTLEILNLLGADLCQPLKEIDE